MADPKNAYVIAVGNQKGGVGKTSNTLHIAAGLGELGKKCLVIDLDANRGTTKALKLGADWNGTFEVLLGDHDAKSVILTEEDDVKLPEGVHVLPARRNLEDFELELRRRPGSKFANPVDCLEKPLADLKSDYDFIFLDTAPNAMAPTVAAYRSADWFLLITEASELSLEGLADALTDINAARDSRNPKLRLLGVVMCKVSERTRTASAYIEKIRKVFEAARENGTFETLISRTIAVEEAQSDGKTLFQTDPTHKVTQQYRDLIQELLKRLENTAAEPEMKVAANG